jgi:hypothetical protein
LRAAPHRCGASAIPAAVEKEPPPGPCSGVPPPLREANRIEGAEERRPSNHLSAAGPRSAKSRYRQSRIGGGGGHPYYSEAVGVGTGRGKGVTVAGAPPPRVFVPIDS